MSDAYVPSCIFALSISKTPKIYKRWLVKLQTQSKICLTSKVYHILKSRIGIISENWISEIKIIKKQIKQIEIKIPIFSNLYCILYHVILVHKCLANVCQFPQFYIKMYTGILKGLVFLKYALSQNYSKKTKRLDQTGPRVP